MAKPLPESKPAPAVTYPREDVCSKCGAHVGWVVSAEGEMFALGLCEAHAEKLDERSYR